MGVSEVVDMIIQIAKVNISEDFLAPLKVGVFLYGVILLHTSLPVTSSVNL